MTMKENRESILRPKTYLIKTYGCQMNERDSETIAGILRRRGLTEAKDLVSTDLLMVNTCAVRDKAEQKVYGLLGKLKALKTENPNLILGVCGCMPQQNLVANRLKERFPFVDIIIGAHNLSALDSYLDRVLIGREQVTDIWLEREKVEQELPAYRREKLKAYVNINWGCNNYCTYCIVPYVRGREKSRPLNTILTEIENLVQGGSREITLLGQNVNSYGKDLPGKPSFAQLLSQVSQVKGLDRIRFMTSHPKDFGAELVDAFSSLAKVCRHLHLPIQAGSDRTLARMNRGYTVARYLEIVENVRAAIPDVALTTDIIVGFPGETEAEFMETIAVLRQVRFDSAFTFMYSPRQGTPAAAMKGQLGTQELKERLQRLLYVQNQISLERNRLLEGTVQEVLVEGFSDQNNKGRTTGNKLVFFPCPRDLSGQLARVKIKQAKTWSLLGELGEEL